MDVIVSILFSSSANDPLCPAFSSIPCLPSIVTAAGVASQASSLRLRSHRRVHSDGIPNVRTISASARNVTENIEMEDEIKGLIEDG